MNTQEDPETDDEELDVTSDKFNPLKAIYSNKFKNPVANVKPLDNVSTFMSRLEKAGNAYDANLDDPRRTQTKKRDRDTKESEETEDDKYHITKAGRRFLKEQGLPWNFSLYMKLNFISHSSDPSRPQSQVLQRSFQEDGCVQRPNRPPE